MEWRAKLAVGPAGFCPAAAQKITTIVLNCFKGFNSADVELHLAHLALLQAVQASDEVDYDSEVEERTWCHRDTKKGKSPKLYQFSIDY